MLQQLLHSLFSPFSHNAAQTSLISTTTCAALLPGFQKDHQDMELCLGCSVSYFPMTAEASKPSLHSHWTLPAIKINQGTLTSSKVLPAPSSQARIGRQRPAAWLHLHARMTCLALPKSETVGWPWSLERYWLSVKDEHLQLAAQTGFIHLQCPGEPTLRIAPAV